MPLPPQSLRRAPLLADFLMKTASHTCSQRFLCSRSLTALGAFSLQNYNMAPTKLFLCAAALAAAVQARPLSDAEMTAFYGYKYRAGPTRLIAPPLDANETLKSAAKRAGIYIAAAVNYDGMTGSSQGPQYPVIALTQFDGFTAENECKVGPIHPEPSTYAFDQCDYLTTTALNNGSMFRWHNTCWDNENPAWLNALKDPVALQAALVQHINNISIHYVHNKSLAPYCIDVVNEAVSDSGSSILKPTTPWYPALSDYVTIAFQTATASTAGTGTLLCYNDYGAEGASSAKAAKIMTLVQELKANGTGINCVGLQMHVSVDQYPTKEDVSANIKQLGALGMTVHSE
jgi:endo-1,4-beta-xylanase